MSEIFLIYFVQAKLEFHNKKHRANSIDLDEVAHDEPPHQGLRCLQILLFSSLILKVLIMCFLIFAATILSV